MVYTKIKRESSRVVLSQKKREGKIIRYYDKIKSLNKFLINALQSKNSGVLADIFKEHWEYKKKLSNQMTSKSLNILFEKLIKKYNFSGGKLVGAGGGGFFDGHKKQKVSQKKIKRSYRLH